jgi:hypothetical protein
VQPARLPQVSHLQPHRLADAQAARVDEPENSFETRLAQHAEEPRHPSRVSTCGNVLAEGERTRSKSFQSRPRCRPKKARIAATAVRIDEGE